MSDPITSADLAEIKAACDAATPGDWDYVPESIAPGFECQECNAVEPRAGVSARLNGSKNVGLHICHMSWANRQEADGKLIVLARTWLPRLVEDNKAKDKQIEDAEFRYMGARETVKRLLIELRELKGESSGL